MQVWRLKSGEFKEGTCVRVEMTEFPPPAPPPGQRRCDARFTRQGTKMIYDAEGITLDEFSKVKIFSTDLDRPLVNKTGLGQRFNIHLEFTPTSDQLKSASDAAGPVAPDLAGALEEQLGIRLRSATGTGERIVIESIERPTAN